MVTNVTNQLNPIAPNALSTTEKAMSDATNSIFEALSVGSITSAIGNSIFGINHRQTPGAIQINKDYFGLTFFTRPELNLSSDNVRAHRHLAPLLSTDDKSLQRIIRCLLDKRLASGSNVGGTITSPLVDEKQAFIPMLTNHLLSISGWPDLTVGTMTSDEGMYKEAFSMVDGISVNYTTYDITANFRNIAGDPITALFLIWIRYASFVYEGVLVPYPEKIINNEIDYNTRIYRLVLDHSKTYVKKIAACGASFPTSTPIGNAFNFDHDRPIDNANDQISIPFRCMGAMYQDDILISEFNKSADLFNPTLNDDALAIEAKISIAKTKIINSCLVPTGALKLLKQACRGSYFTKIPPDSLALFNNKGYPHIDIDTYELGWYVDNDVYDSFLPPTA